MSNTVFANLSRVTLLISHDRSGSHYLGSFIRALPNYLMIDEVCNEQAVDPVENPDSFFGFRYKQSMEKPDYSLRRNPTIVAELLDEYFASLIARAEEKDVVVDIKYGHIHNFEVAWWPIFRKPFLFEYARGRKLKIIHLSRWNSMETVISSHVAEARKVWHAVGDKPSASPDDAINVDKHQLLNQILALNQQKEAIAKWTQNLPVLALLYEELVHPVMGEETKARIAEFLKTTVPEEISNPYKKVTPQMHLVVRNWKEISKFCRENGLAHYLLPFNA